MIGRCVSAVAVSAAVMVLIAADSPAPLRVQADVLDSLVSANSRSLSLDGGRLKGPGAEWLLAEAARAQFLAIGEEHNVVEIPQLITALLTDLEPRAGYRYVALEQDPTALRAASVAPMRGRPDSIVAYSHRYQHAFTFMSDQELAMIADVGRIANGRGNPLWGLDQSFGVTHALDRLTTITRGASPQAAALMKAYRDTAAIKEKTRNLEKYHYMSAPKSEDFAKLGELLKPSAKSEAAFLIDNLVVSDRVYRAYRERRGYDNGYEREEYMKRRFMDEYRIAEAADHAAPKVILKFGHWHLYRGLGPSNLQTLGNFVSELARVNGGQSFHVSVHGNNPAGAYRTLTAWPDSFPDPLIAKRLPTDSWTIVDLRPLRVNYRRISATLRPDQRDQFVRLVFGFDAALYLGGMRPGTYTHNPGVEY